MTPAQLTALKAAITAVPALLALWTAGSTGALRDEVNKPGATGDVNAVREVIDRVVISRNMAGKLAARDAALRARMIGVSNKAADPLLADLSVLETKLATIINAQAMFERLPAFSMADSAVRTFVSNVLATLVSDTAISAADRTAFEGIGRGAISMVESIAGLGVRASEEHVIAAMKGA